MTRDPHTVTFCLASTEAIEVVEKANATEAWAFADRLTRQSEATEVISITRKPAAITVIRKAA